jgi:hypothetical protein
MISKKALALGFVTNAIIIFISIRFQNTISAVRRLHKSYWLTNMAINRSAFGARSPTSNITLLSNSIEIYIIYLRKITPMMERETYAYIIRVNMVIRHIYTWVCVNINNMQYIFCIRLSNNNKMISQPAPDVDRQLLHIIFGCKSRVEVREKINE